MARAYKCDICDRLFDDAYAVSGIDFYQNELVKIGGIDRDKARKKEVKEICSECHEAIQAVRNELWIKSHMFKE